MAGHMVLPQSNIGGVGIDLDDLRQQVSQIDTLVLCREGKSRSKDGSEMIPDSGYLESGLQWLDTLYEEDLIEVVKILASVNNIIFFISDTEYKQFEKVISTIKRFHPNETHHIRELIELHKLPNN